MAELLVVKAGSETPDLANGMSYPIPKCLDQLRVHARVLVTEDEAEQTLIQAVKGATVLIITYGTFARMCQGFGMAVQAFDPNVSWDAMQVQSVVKLDDLATLAETSDVVVICVPLNPTTHHLIDADFLRQMKNTAFVINVGRGATIDEIALLDALDTGQIAGCGLDVFSNERLNHVDHPLRRMLIMENVVISPHLAAWSHETWDRLQDEVTAHVLDVLAGRSLTIRSNDPRLAGQRHCVYENSPPNPNAASKNEDCTDLRGQHHD